MTIENIKTIMNNNSKNIAFIIGNGINRYQYDPRMFSWESLLSELWKKATNCSITEIPEGISLTEFFDILTLKNNQNLDIQLEVASLLYNSEASSHHEQIVNKIKKFNAPILTTNFDINIAKKFNFELKKIGIEKSIYYPWNFYYSDLELDEPTLGFGIWHINGMIKYKQSIRLGLTHYIGSISKARKLIHNDKDENNLFTGKNISFWKGYTTWLHIIFNKALFIFGLKLEENETFLRWLLIERMKYFKKFPDRKCNGW